MYDNTRTVLLCSLVTGFCSTPVYAMQAKVVKKQSSTAARPPHLLPKEETAASALLVKSKAILEQAGQYKLSDEKLLKFKNIVQGLCNQASLTPSQVQELQKLISHLEMASRTTQGIGLTDLEKYALALSLAPRSGAKASFPATAVHKVAPKKPNNFSQITKKVAARKVVPAKKSINNSHSSEQVSGASQTSSSDKSPEPNSAYFNDATSSMQPTFESPNSAYIPSRGLKAPDRTAPISPPARYDKQFPQRSNGAKNIQSEHRQQVKRQGGNGTQNNIFPKQPYRNSNPRGNNNNPNTRNFEILRNSSKTIDFSKPDSSTNLAPVVDFNKDSNFEKEEDSALETLVQNFQDEMAAEESIQNNWESDLQDEMATEEGVNLPESTTYTYRDSAEESYPVSYEEGGGEELEDEGTITNFALTEDSSYFQDESPADNGNGETVYSDYYEPAQDLYNQTSRTAEDFEVAAEGYYQPPQDYYSPKNDQPLFEYSELNSPYGLYPQNSGTNQQFYGCPSSGSEQSYQSDLPTSFNDVYTASYTSGFDGGDSGW